MNPLARTVIAVLAVAVAVGGAVYVLRPGNQAGGPSPAVTGSPTLTAAPTPSPTASSGARKPTPTPLDPATWVAFTSDRHGYTMAHPADWSVTKATRPWLFGTPGDRAGDGTVDLFTSRAPALYQWVVSSQAIPKGMTDEDWFAAYLAGTQMMPAGCFPPHPQWPSDAIDGHLAGVHGGLPTCGFTEAAVVVGGRAYVFTGYTGVTTGAIFDQYLFDALLPTIRLQPTKANDAPVASPGPS